MHTYRLPLHLHIYDAPVMFELPKKQIHLAGKSVFRWNQSVFKRVCFLFKEMSAVMCGSPHPSFIPVSMFVYLFVSACWEKAIIRFKQHKVSQPAEIQLCSSLCTDPPPPHIPLSVAGVTAGPDVAPFQSAFVPQMALASSFLLLSTSSWSPSCAAALQRRYLSLCKYEQLIN